MKTEGGRGHLQAKQRGLSSHPCQRLVLRLLPPELWDLTSSKGLRPSNSRKRQRISAQQLMNLACA